MPTILFLAILVLTGASIRHLKHDTTLDKAVGIYSINPWCFGQGRKKRDSPVFARRLASLGTTFARAQKSPFLTHRTPDNHLLRGNRSKRHHHILVPATSKVSLKGANASLKSLRVLQPGNRRFCRPRGNDRPLKPHTLLSAA